MSKSKDWLLPGGRAAILGMAMKWNTVLAMKGQGWGVPADKITELNTLTLNAQAAFNAANTKDRTKVLTQMMNDAFNPLIALMRFIKERWFKSPELSAADFLSLDLNIPDTTKTARARPTAMKTGQLILVNQGMLRLRSDYTESSAHEANAHSDIENHIRWGIYNPLAPVSNPETGEMDKIPTVPEDLPKSMTTKRRIEDFNFGTRHSGSRAYFAIRISNGKGEDGYGPWCPLFDGVIP